MVPKVPFQHATRRLDNPSAHRTSTGSDNFTIMTSPSVTDIESRIAVGTIFVSEACSRGLYDRPHNFNFSKTVETTPGLHSLLLQIVRLTVAVVPPISYFDITSTTADSKSKRSACHGKLTTETSKAFETFHPIPLIPHLPSVR